MDSGLKGRHAAIKEERPRVGEEKREGWKEHESEGNNECSRDSEYTNIKEKGVEQR